MFVRSEAISRALSLDDGEEEEEGAEGVLGDDTEQEAEQQKQARASGKGKNGSKGRGGDPMVEDGKEGDSGVEEDDAGEGQGAGGKGSKGGARRQAAVKADARRKQQEQQLAVREEGGSGSDSESVLESGDDEEVEEAGDGDGEAEAEEDSGEGEGAGRKRKAKGKAGAHKVSRCGRVGHVGLAGRNIIDTVRCARKAKGNAGAHKVSGCGRVRRVNCTHAVGTFSRSMTSRGLTSIQTPSISVRRTGAALCSCVHGDPLFPPKRVFRSQCCPCRPLVPALWPVPTPTLCCYLDPWSALQGSNEGLKPWAVVQLMALGPSGDEEEAGEEGGRKAPELVKVRKCGACATVPCHTVLCWYCVNSNHLGCGDVHARGHVVVVVVVVVVDRVCHLPPCHTHAPFTLITHPLDALTYRIPPHS